MGDDNEESQIPFQQYLAPAVGKGEIHMISDNSESLINIIRILQLIREMILFLL